ncbi:hypothetical protein U0070_003670 [Myodes glareolus]|uniref:Uncharacterized protein n=1 Tax=Myodes glareolus TaxID=447135 RepID=A0AAW0H7A9_MYOGA
MAQMQVWEEQYNNTFHVVSTLLILCQDWLRELELDDNCAEALDGELDGLWTTITIFITLFLLSVCYSATVTLFKVGVAPPLSL